MFNRLRDEVSIAWSRRISYISPLEQTENDMNILARIRWEYVSATLNTLPDVDTATEDTIQTIFEVPDMGKVRFTYGITSTGITNQPPGSGQQRKRCWWNHPGR